MTECGVLVSNPCLSESSSLISRLTFSWLTPVFKRGYQRELDFKDIGKAPRSNDIRIVSRQMKSAWTKELQTNSPSLRIALLRAFGWTYFRLTLFFIFVECGLRISQPFLVGTIIRYFSQSESNPVSKSSAYFAVGLLSMTSIAIIICRNQYFAILRMSGINLGFSLDVLIYKKMLKLSLSSIQSTSIGAILNLINRDSVFLEEFTYMLPVLIVAPLQAIVLIYIMWGYIGYATLAGFAILIVYIPFQGMMFTLIKKSKHEATKLTSKRVELMSEIISAIRLIKVYCWEKPFAHKVNEVRQQEMNAISWTQKLRAMNVSLNSVATKFMLLPSLVVYVLIGGQLTTETVFVVVALYNILAITVNEEFPYAIGVLSEGIIAMNRIQDFLSLDEKKDVKPGTKAKGTIELENYSAKWSPSQPTNCLDNITLKARPGQLTVIIGSVGSGKTCLLKALLGELETSGKSEKCDVSGKVSYFPQESWCFSGTVRENILLGHEFDEIKFEQVVDACGLRRDLDHFPNGDLTMVGEKGYTLSGGQKARITLARAAYHDADVYLLDDPLSAVDPKVANHIFANCIKDYLANKTVVLVTHQLQFIKSADLIVVMENGTISAQGTYEAMMKSGIDFFSLLAKEEKLTRSVSEDSNPDHNQRLENDDLNEEVPLQVKDKQEKAGDSKLSQSSSKWKTFWNYIRSGASIPLLMTSSSIAIGSTIICNYSQFWLSDWTKSSVEGREGQSSIWYFVLLNVLAFVITFSYHALFYQIAAKSSFNLHKRIFKKVLKSRMQFFETTAIGTVLNRFTKDLGSVDSGIPDMMIESLGLILTQVGLMAVSIIIKPVMIIPSVAIIILALVFKDFYTPTSSSLVKLCSRAHEPVMNHIATTFNGLLTIRSMSTEEQFQERFFDKMSDLIAVNYHFLLGSRYTNFILDMIALIYVISIYVILIVFPNRIEGGDAGLVLASALALINFFQMGVRVFAKGEILIVSAERVLEYSKLESEPDFVSEPRKEQDSVKDWPNDGKIKYKDVTLRYSPISGPVLRSINFDIKAREKIGIVGRTGAGKSSLVTVLFRLADFDGMITIDGVDTKSTGLTKLRSKISIIPQDPILFSGTVRRNLDPFNEYSNEELWKAIKESNLTPLVEAMDGQLEATISEGGSNLSVGQRQLLCLSRALLKKNMILVLDEATANVDHETDLLIQNTIKDKFADCTVLTVAHRINTILDADRIMVMEDGQLIEFDSPQSLLASKGKFYEMFQASKK